MNFEPKTIQDLTRACFLIAGILSAAKLHGRQLRLEREDNGYFEVYFGGENPPYVEGLWKKDAAILKKATYIGIALFGIYALLRLSLVIGIFGAGYAFIGGFFVATLASFKRGKGASNVSGRVHEEEEAWGRPLATIGWVLLTLILIWASYSLPSPILGALNYLSQEGTPAF